MSNRIAELRSILGMSQAQFGERLGLGKSTISRMESGILAPTKQTLKFICREFNVSYLWLTEGAGEIFREDDHDILAMIDIILSDATEAERDAFRNFARKDKKCWIALNNFMDSLIESEE